VCGVLFLFWQSDVHDVHVVLLQICKQDQIWLGLHFVMELNFVVLHGELLLVLYDSFQSLMKIE